MVSENSETNHDKLITKSSKSLISILINLFQYITKFLRMKIILGH